MYNKVGYNHLKARHNRPLCLGDSVWAILSLGDFVRLPNNLGRYQSSTKIPILTLRSGMGILFTTK